MLVLEIEYLTGVAVAASAYDRATAEWPPHPDRVFSALVCAWAERGKNDEERHALEWLERLGPPQIISPNAGFRQVPHVYVPPNDLETPARDTRWLRKLRAGKALDKQKGEVSAFRRARAVLPELRNNRQARQLPVVIPHDPKVRLIWRNAGLAETEQHRAALNRLVRAVPYLGHSSSLVRISLRADGEIEASHVPDPQGDLRLRCPYPGRLKELTQGYDTADPGRPFRPSRAPAKSYRQASTSTFLQEATVFGRDWIVLADAGGEAPALEAFAIVAKSLRDALMSLASDPVPELVSGHAADGSPSRDPHLAIVPLADVGWRYSSGRLMGVGLVLPRAFEHELWGSPERRASLRAIAQFSVSEDREAGALKLGVHGVWRLRRDPRPEAQSLRSWRYSRTGRRWATVTPFVFDRFPKDKDEQDAGAIVAQACINIGLAPPIEIELHKHSAFRGAPSAKRHRGEPATAGYRIPKESALAHRPLRHLVLIFEQPVRGPVLLGAGRFQGLGLCLPLGDENGS